MELRLNQILIPGLGSSILAWSHRVLALDIEADRLWCISLPRLRENGRFAAYMTGPRTLSLALVSEALESGELKQVTFTAPGHWSMTDKDYVSEAATDTEKERRKARLKERDHTWAIISPLIGDTSTQTLVRQLSALRPALVDRAAKCGVDITTVYRLLHLYMANGSTLNGLMPATERCGAPGKQREQRKRLGRKSNAYKRGDTTSDGYILTAQDKERLARGFALIKPTLPPRAAYLLTCGVFWADSTVCVDGSTKRTLYEAHRRPTFQQFRYWGAKMNTGTGRRNRLGMTTRDKPPTHHGGSSQDLACAVGQVAMLDATSTDVYLTSIYSRHSKLPPMTRTLVKELRSGVYLGLYVGWEAPSPNTALQAILNGAEDGVELCKRFGITIGPDEWPGMLCRTYMADNGEMRAAAMTSAEEQFGFGIEFAKTYSGDSKGDVESQHHTDHKRFDHRVPGSTRGKQRERGEPHPADLALWHYFEYMRELLLYIIEYNNSEVRERAPTEMIIAGVRPTRLNIFRWLRDHNQRADIPFDVDQLRAVTLPEWPAVMQHNGIIVKTADGAKNIPGLRFFSEALRDDHRFKHANTSRAVVPISIRFKPESLGEIWLPTSRGLLRIPNVTSDERLRREGTLQDLLDHMKSEDVRRDQAKQADDQAELDTVIRREGITATATREAVEELKSMQKKVSKSKQRSGMRSNKAIEQEAVGKIVRGNGESPTTSTRTQVDKLPSVQAASSDAANRAMASFLESIKERR